MDKNLNFSENNEVHDFINDSITDSRPVKISIKENFVSGNFFATMYIHNPDNPL